jgi:hypothetical protein
MNRWLKASLLLFFFALCAVAVLVTHALSQRRPDPRARELLLVVNRQLSSFRAADFESAYHHSATAVQQKFSQSQFELMIRRDFSSMTAVQRVEFGALRVAGSNAVLQVFLTTPDGAVRAYLYSFTCEADGWKIDGVESLGPQPLRHLPGLHV